MSIEEHIFEADPTVRKRSVAGLSCLEVAYPGLDIRLFGMPGSGQNLLVHAKEDSFSIKLAKVILARRPSLPIDKSVVVPINVKHSEFNRIVYMPPPAPQYDGVDDRLALQTVWAFPAYACEFNSDQSWEQVYNYLYKRPMVRPFDWRRPPEPRILFQLLDPWPGGMFRKLKRPMVDKVANVISMLGQIPTKIAVRLENNWGEQIDVCRETRSRYRVGDSATHNFDKTSLVNVVTSFTKIKNGLLLEKRAKKRTIRKKK